MGRLIDADVLKKDLTRFYDGEVVARRLIDEQPTVDAVPVVRCKDCKWCNMGECEHKLGLIWANDENYCSLGERKDGEQRV